MTGTVIRRVRYRPERSWRSNTLPFPNEPATSPLNRMASEVELAQSIGRPDADALAYRLQRIAAAKGYKYPL